MNVDKGDLKSLHRRGRGMRLYLDIAQVDSNGSPRRLFLCNMITRKVYVYDT